MSHDHDKKEQSKMTYKRLGNSGLKVSRICVGTMGFGVPGFWMANKVIGQEDATKIVAAAWKAGINFFDTGHFYSNGASEEILGKAIKDLEIPRDEIVISTKVGLGWEKKLPAPGAKEGAVTKSITVNSFGLNRKNLFDSVDAALKRLQTDYIDIYQIARWDNTTSIEETMKALHDLVQSGKIRYIGASSMYAWQFAKAQFVAAKNGWTQFISMQNLYNAVYREEEREMIPLCQDLGVGLIPWSPLAHGYLVNPEPPKELGPRTSWYDDGSKAVLDVVTKLATEKKVSNAQIALAWLLHKDAVAAPIVGITSLKNLEDAIQSVNVKLTKEEVEELEKPYKTRPVQGWLS